MDGWGASICHHPFRLDTTQSGGIPSSQSWRTIVLPEAPIVPERWDGRMKPGELQSGGYGFYYKGQQQSYSPQQQDVLKDLEES